MPSGETKSAARRRIVHLERSKSDIITRLLVLSLIIGNHKDIYLANKERIGGAQRSYSRRGSGMSSLR